MIHVFDVFFHVEYDGAVGFTIEVNAKALGAKVSSLFLSKMSSY